MPEEAALNWKQRGDECIRQEQYDEALQCYQNAINLDPDFVAAWNNIGYSLSKLGRKEEANKIRDKINEIKYKEKISNDVEQSPKIEEVKPEEKTSDDSDRVALTSTESKPDQTKPKLEHRLQNGIDTVTKKSLGVLGSLGGAVGSISGTLKAGSRKISYFTLLRNHEIHVKNLIISEMKLHDLRKICVYYNIGAPSDIRTNSRGYRYRVRLTYDDWARHVFKNLELTKLREYARANYKLPSKIIEIEKEYKRERIQKYPEYEQDNGTLSYRTDGENVLLHELTNKINEYQPIKPFRNEELYHTNLYTYLCEKIPGEIGFEVQRGSSRPDIVVGDIAIEIKGPTDNQGLITIADKINRYSQHFEHIIVVLFEVQSLERFYNEWFEGIMRQYGDLVTIIRK